MKNDKNEQVVEQLKWLTAAMLNNTIKQVEIECVRCMGRELSLEEKNMIHRDCFEELVEVRALLDDCQADS